LDVCGLRLYKGIERCRQRIVANAREAEEDWGRKGLAAMREVVIVALAAFLIAIMVTALLVHFLP
jgi:hypothetical protein